jgi:AcrR family transcriptional regulator
MARPSQRDVQAATRRNQLIDLALMLFAERGVENVTIKDLATEARVAQGLIYHYFESKDQLLAAVLTRHNPLPEFAAIIEMLRDLPAREGLLRFAQELAALLPRKRLVFRLIARELLSPRSEMLPQVLSFREEAVTLLIGYLQRRIDAGDLRPHQPLISIHMLVSSFITLQLLDQPLEPFVQPLVETILGGIEAK